MDEKKPESFAKLNDELLAPTKDDEDKKPGRNSKEDLIAKIVACCADNDIPLPHSDTRLRRMTKQQLLKLLAEVLEQGVRDQMAHQVGAKRGASDGVIALGALKMIHSIAANATEKGLNEFLPDYGYEIDGFHESLQQPVVKEAVDICLAAGPRGPAALALSLFAVQSPLNFP